MLELSDSMALKLAVAFWILSRIPMLAVGELRSIRVWYATVEIENITRGNLSHYIYVDALEQ